MEGLTDINNKLTLFRNDVELRFQIAVNTLTRLTANGDDSSIGTPYLFVNGDSVDANLRIFLRSHCLCLEPFRGMALYLELHFCIIDILTVDVSQHL